MLQLYLNTSGNIAQSNRKAKLSLRGYFLMSEVQQIVKVLFLHTSAGQQTDPVL